MIEARFHLNYPGFTLDVALDFPGHGVTALFGPSGSGKTTILRCFAGLIRAPGGRLRVGNDVWQDDQTGVFLPTYRRPLGMVFQDANLFPHLTVHGNLKYGMKRAGTTRASADFDAVLALLGINSLLDRMPLNLSGGERQRVAIARALLTRPQLLLMDEPLAALDMERRLEILPLIERLRDEFAVPTVYVSHAIEEVARLADQVVVLDAGRVRGMGRPEEVLGVPASEGEKGRFDRISVLAMKVCGYNAAYGLTELKHPAGTVWLAGKAGQAGGRVRIVVRTTDIVLSARPPEALSVRSVLRGRVAAIEETGPLAAVEIALKGEGRLGATVTRHALDELGLAPGAEIFALIKTSALDERHIAVASRCP